MLSRLHSFTSPTLELEQYATPSHIAAEWIWNMALKGEVRGRTFLDAACGPGILGLGLLLMGAFKVFFLDRDPQIMEICMRNYSGLEQEYEISKVQFVVGDISIFDEHVDIVVQNPPFGTKEEHADKRFLEKAFQVAPIVYSMHKWSTKQFAEAVCKDYGFRITDVWRFDFPIKATHEFHRKPSVNIDVGLWRMEKE